MFEFGDVDQFSFNDSERFDENDSICSWISDPDAVVNNWRGWQKPQAQQGQAAIARRNSSQALPASLGEFATPGGGRDPSKNSKFFSSLFQS